MAKIFKFKRIKIPKIKSKGQGCTMRYTIPLWRNKMKPDNYAIEKVTF